MDKLQRYNQKILAVLGTLLVATLGVLLIIGIVAWTISLFKTSPSDNSGIQVNHGQVQHDSTILRTQQITYQNPVWLDTSKTDFLIPVGQVNLETAEKVRKHSSSLLNTYSSEDYWFDSQYGLYNNFILFEYQTNARTRIFDHKVAITQWAQLKAGQTEVLLFSGAGKDLNGDNLINGDDYQTLYVFYLSDKKLVEYSFEHKTVLSFEPMKKTNLIAIRVGEDKNGDLEFEQRKEPQEILVLNVESRQVENLIPPAMHKEIQKTIDQ